MEDWAYFHRLISSARPADQLSRAAQSPGGDSAHPLGQTLVVTAGSGWAQRWGGQKEEIRPGDVI